MRWLPDNVLSHLRKVAADEETEPDFTGTRYRLEGRIGRGGMAIVYAAEDSLLRRKVAIKVARTSTSRTPLNDRLEGEARVLAQLEHPGIVPVHDVGTLPDGHVYYAMKLVKGERLDRWLKSEALAPRREALRLFQRICEALAFAHAHGVLHRDVKPENVMVGEFGEALLMDWGIAATEEERAAEPDAVVVGTPSFMAPEQARGEAIDERADVYGLGATLNVILHSEDRGRRPNPQPAALLSIAAKATSEKREDRYASAEALGRDIGNYLDGAEVSAHKETLVESVTRIAIRHRVLLTLLAAYILMRVVLVLFAR